MGMKIERIMVPTDFSEHSLEALRTAMSLKSDFGSEVVVLHVFDISEMLGLGWTVYGESLEAEVVARRYASIEDAVLAGARLVAGLGPRAHQLLAEGVDADQFVGRDGDEGQWF